MDPQGTMPGAPFLAFFARSGLPPKAPSASPAANTNGPGISEAVATANNSFPAKVTLLLSRQSGLKSSYFKEGRTLPYEPPLPLRDILDQRGMDLEGLEPSPAPWQETVLRYPQAHAKSLCLVDLERRLGREI